jgi:hypothetical protein
MLCLSLRVKDTCSGFPAIYLACKFTGNQCIYFVSEREKKMKANWMINGDAALIPYWQVRLYIQKEKFVMYVSKTMITNSIHYKVIKRIK